MEEDHKAETADAASTSLYTLLASALPSDSSFTFYHVSSPPVKCNPLFAAAPGDKQQRTYCESHFLTASVHRPVISEHQQVLVYAIEILVYSTRTLTTLFVSKADSTGYLKVLDSSPSIPAGSSIRSVTSTFVSWLAEKRQRPDIPLVVSLFARAQDQYLFPGSIKNPGKHVLDDRQLVRWWCRTLDPVLRQPERHVSDSDAPTAQAYVIVPGFDKNETASFFPASARANPAGARKWQFGHPLRDIAPKSTAPPRCLVPRFPDDPKARYLEDLDGEIPDQASSQPLSSPSKRGRGAWSSIKTLEQFWETMAFRQECSSGRLVGFIWLVFSPRPSIHATHLRPSPSPLPTPPPGDIHPIESRLSSQSNRSADPRERTRRKKLTGPIIPRQPRIKSSTSALSTTDKPEAWLEYTPINRGHGQAHVDHPSYTRIHDLLLRLDFSNVDTAAKSTRRWVDEVKVVIGKSTEWGANVTGQLARPVVDVKSTHSAHNVTYVTLVSPHPLIRTDGYRQANDLSGMIVRKKRKPEAEQTDSLGVTASSAPVNTLSGGLVRKKPKAGNQ